MLDKQPTCEEMIVAGRESLEARHEAERLTLARSVREQKDAAVLDIDNTYDRKRVQLLHAKAREAAAYRKETGQLATAEFERRAWDSIREARQRREEEKTWQGSGRRP